MDYTNPILGGCFGPGCLIRQDEFRFSFSTIIDDSLPASDSILWVMLTREQIDPSPEDPRDLSPTATFTGQSFSLFSPSLDFSSFPFDLVADSHTAGHSTHVTGTIAALPNKLGFTGVAPEATIGHYRIFGCEGSASEDVVSSALSRNSRATS